MTHVPQVAVVVPAYNEPASALRALYDSLVHQTLKDFEVIVVDDHSDSPCYQALDDARFSVVYKDSNTGPAASRNIGAKRARAPILFFTDADCRLAPDTLENAREALRLEQISMGDTRTVASTYTGKAIGFLGIPGGGLLGFHRVWRVSPEGYTDSISSCNLAIKSDIFDDLGGFDESFPVPAGEDTVFARHALERGLRIRYTPSQFVFHEERSSIGDFARWQYTRGRGVFHVKRRVGSIRKYAIRRFAVLRTAIASGGVKYGPAVLLLFMLSLACQWYGFRAEARRSRKDGGL